MHLETRLFLHINRNVCADVIIFILFHKNFKRATPELLNYAVCHIKRREKQFVIYLPPTLIKTNEKIDYESSTSAVPCSYLELDVLLCY